MYDPDSDYFYKRIFLDISRGFSACKYKETTYYIKHLSSEDYIDLSDKEEEFYQKAIKRGLPTEKEALEEAIKEGLWTSEDDDFLETQKMCKTKVKRVYKTLSMYQRYTNLNFY